MLGHGLGVPAILIMIETSMPPSILDRKAYGYWLPN
jgi:hypothetical protein